MRSPYLLLTTLVVRQQAQHRDSAAPHGPRSPVQVSHSRTPSPGTPKLEPQVNGYGHDGYGHDEDVQSLNGVGGARDQEDYDYTPVKPSAKALGKRKVVEPEAVPDPPFDPDDIYYSKDNSFLANDTKGEPDFEDETDTRWRRPPTQFVYDAVAERTRQRLEGEIRELRVANGVH
ncbi:hypothetical protein NLJ89_g10199 [Agrocybe chaxingu]|uniref:Uncharacterized protein n=1 Tax=Agrocybe chaxingu TaxID=84603 RepID=A0A9W8JYL8_9AGAR|nr:hypothetical protein NLJ89_g10199 [Agrocybe chaxingu]